MTTETTNTSAATMLANLIAPFENETLPIVSGGVLDDDAADDCVDATSPDSIASFLDTLAADVCDQAVLRCYGAQDLVALGFRHCHCDWAPLIDACDPPHDNTATELDLSAESVRNLARELLDIAAKRTVKAAEMRKAERFAKYDAEIKAALALGTAAGYATASRLVDERDGTGQKTDEKVARTVAGETPSGDGHRTKTLAKHAREAAWHVAERIGGDLLASPEIQAIAPRKGTGASGVLSYDVTRAACEACLKAMMKERIMAWSPNERANIEAGANLPKK